MTTAIAVTNPARRVCRAHGLTIELHIEGLLSLSLAQKLHGIADKRCSVEPAQCVYIRPRGALRTKRGQDRQRHQIGPAGSEMIDRPIVMHRPPIRMARRA